MTEDINITPEEWEKLEDFPDHPVSPEGEHTLKKEWEADPLFAQKLSEVRETTIAIKEYYLFEKLEAWHKEIPPRKGMVGFFRSKPYMAAAAVLLLIIIGIWQWSLSKSQRLYQEFYYPDPGLATVMSVSDQYDFEKAMVDYKMKNYQEALEAWMVLQEQNPGNDTLAYFIGCALLAQGNAAASEAYFARTVRNHQGNFFREAYWYWGLALIKEGKLKEAKDKIERSDRKEKIVLLDKLE